MIISHSPVSPLHYCCPLVVREGDTVKGHDVEGIDSESVPRVITSRSHNKSGGDVRQMSKLEVKLMVVESAINSILAAVKDDEMKAVSRKQTLDGFLKYLEERD